MGDVLPFDPDERRDERLRYEVENQKIYDFIITVSNSLIELYTNFLNNLKKVNEDRFLRKIDFYEKEIKKLRGLGNVYPISELNPKIKLPEITTDEIKKYLNYIEMQKDYIKKNILDYYDSFKGVRDKIIIYQFAFLDPNLLGRIIDIKNSNHKIHDLFISIEYIFTYRNLKKQLPELIKNTVVILNSLEELKKGLSIKLKNK